ncbi:MAG: MFS transporter [Rhodospirillales bacterium]|nr:MFS transporter [Rhodospirillales bacterium]
MNDAGTGIARPHAAAKALRRRALFAGGTAHAIHDGLGATMYVLLPIWQQELGLLLTQVGLLKSVYSGAMASFQVPAGFLGERRGERMPLVVGTAVSGLAFLLLGAAPGFIALLATIFLVGIGASAQHPLASSLVARAYEEGSRRAALSIYNFAGDVGKFLLPAAAGLILSLGDWRLVTSGFGASALAVAAVLFAVLVVARLGAKPADAPAAPLAEAKGDGWGVRDWRGFQALGLIQVVDDGSRAAFLTFLPFVITAKGGSIATAGLALTLVFIGGAAGKFACGVLAERFGVIRTVLVTEVVTASAIVLLVLLPLTPALLLLPILGVVLNGTSSVLYGTVAELVVPERRARAFGLFYTLGSVSGGVAPTVFGVVSDVAGIDVSMTAIGAFVLLTIPLAFILSRALAAAPTLHPA